MLVKTKYSFLNMINKHRVNFCHCHTCRMIPTLWVVGIAYIFIPPSFMIMNNISKRIVFWGQSYQWYYSFLHFLVFQIWSARAKVTSCFLLFHAKKILMPFFRFITVIRLHTSNAKLFIVYFSNWSTRRFLRQMIGHWISITCFWQRQRWLLWFIYNRRSR